ncbi:unnamed protein product [Staurois parvus]|uniref:Uncharacterized protein n=1 Tax=Staurois parvus TaxID=386267 RepID=A0ABN9D0R3_9NEOB|nr:unnamed protein product [Staurois parvus]
MGSLCPCPNSKKPMIKTEYILWWKGTTAAPSVTPCTHRKSSVSGLDDSRPGAD